MDSTIFSQHIRLTCERHEAEIGVPISAEGQSVSMMNRYIIEEETCDVCKTTLSYIAFRCAGDTSKYAIGGAYCRGCDTYYEL